MAWTEVRVEEILEEKQGGFLLLIEGDEVFIPKGVIADASDCEEGEKGVTLLIADWYARKNGL